MAGWTSSILPSPLSPAGEPLGAAPHRNGSPVDDFERTGGAFVFGHRDITAGAKSMAVEAEDRLVVRIIAGLVGKGPLAPPPVNELPVLIVRSHPKAPDDASPAILL